jgi:hypothetical protein
MRQCEIDPEDEHDGFRLVQALLWGKTPTSSVCCITPSGFVAPDELQAATYIIMRTPL